MTGLRKEIAKHVVLNILETLSEDDFVTIYSFSKTPRPLVKCFSRDVEGDERAELVQVNFWYCGKIAIKYGGNCPPK